VTTVKARFYPHSEYIKFTPAEKQKHYQIMKNETNMTKKSSATVAELTSAVSAVSAAASAISELTAATQSALPLKMGRTMKMMRLPTLNGDGTATTPQLLAAKSACLRSQRPDQLDTALCLCSIQPNWLLTLDGTLLTLVLK
jgi:hypothetical protein